MLKRLCTDSLIDSPGRALPAETSDLLGKTSQTFRLADCHNMTSVGTNWTVFLVISLYFLSF